MISQLQYIFITKRLKAIHITMLLATVCFFVLLFVFGYHFETNMLPAQLTLLLMGALLSVSYVSLALHKKRSVPLVPLANFFLLNVLTTLLVWFTGSLESPFVIFYLILIIITAQLYSYTTALLQTVLSFVSLVIVFAAVSQDIIPYYSLIPPYFAGLPYYPIALTLIFGILYAVLFLLTALTSSSARTLLYKPHTKTQLDTTYHEKILQVMPTPVMVVDIDLSILGGNQAAQTKLKFKNGASLTDYVTCDGELVEHLKSGHTFHAVWKDKAGEKEILVHAILDNKPGKQSSYILFVKVNS